MELRRCRVIWLALPLIVGCEVAPDEVIDLLERVEHHQELTDGWDDAPGSGRVFVIDSLRVAGREEGFDLDGRCRTEGSCIDNSLWQIGALGNDQIRQGLLGGETLILVEVTGIDEPFYGDDAAVTVKIYAGRDADDPFFPANNFQPPAGDTECCAFLINPVSLIGDPPQARLRVRAHLEGDLLRSIESPDWAVPSSLDGASYPGLPGSVEPPMIELDRAHVRLRLRSDSLKGRTAASLEEGLLGSAIPLGALARFDNPVCKTLNNLCQRNVFNSSLLDFLAPMLQPDIDLDGDGLELVLGGAEGLIAECYDGCTPPACPGAPVPPLSPQATNSCALSPRLADGYSISLGFTAVSAQIVGVDEAR